MAKVTIRTWQPNAAYKTHLVPADPFTLKSAAETACGKWVRSSAPGLNPTVQILGAGELAQMSQSGAYCKACLKAAAQEEARP